MSKFCFCCSSSNNLISNPLFEMNIRPASHASSWYEEEKEELSQQLNDWLRNTNQFQKNKQLKAIISPHAGYRSFLSLPPSLSLTSFS